MWEIEVADFCAGTYCNNLFYDVVYKQTLPFWCKTCVKIFRIHKSIFRHHGSSNLCFFVVSVMILIFVRDVNRSLDNSYMTGNTSSSNWNGQLSREYWKDAFLMMYVNQLAVFKPVQPSFPPPPVFSKSCLLTYTTAWVDLGCHRWWNLYFSLNFISNLNTHVPRFSSIN